MEDKYRQALESENDCWLSVETQELAREFEVHLQRAIEPTWRKVGRVIGRAMWNEASIKWLSGMACLAGAPPVSSKDSENPTDSRY